MADTKRLVIGMLVALGLIFGWQYFVAWLSVRQGWTTTPATQPAMVSTAPSSTQPTVTQEAVVGPSSMQATTAEVTPTTRLAAATTRPATTAQLGQFELQKDGKQTYVLGVALDPAGAGIDRVVLNEFPKHAEKKEDRDRPYAYQEPYWGYEQESRPMATRWVKVDGQTVDLAGVQWGLVKQTAASATYEVVVKAADGALRIEKTYRIQDRQAPGMGYEVLVTYALHNESDRAMTVSAAFNGPTMPVKEFTADQRQVVAGYWDTGHGRVKVGHEMGTSFGPKMASKSFAKNPDGFSALWAGTSSVYFDAIVQPKASSVADIEAKPLDLNASDAELRNVVLTFQTTEIQIKARQAAELPLSVYFGPKARNVLQDKYYAASPRSYGLTLTTLGGSCSFCTFGWLVDAMVWLLAAFHYVFGGFAGHGDWGLAIIGLVAIVRIILHPITKRSTISMQKMSKMAPEMERLRKKYGDNKEELNKAMWQFQKEQGFTPIFGCLPMFLQMPIWIALWTSLQSTFELRQAPFLQFGWLKMTWINDLSQPDRLISFGQSIPLLFFHIDAINLLPILLAGVFYLQQKYTPQAPASTPEQAQQQKMMKWMSLIFPIFLYGSPSGLNLYILTSTTVGIIESKRIRDHIKQKEEAEKAGVVIVDDVKPTRASRMKGPEKKQVKKAGLAGWLAELQERAEQVRRDSDKRK